MAQMSADVEMGPGVGYYRHRPEDTLLYQIIERYYPLFEVLKTEQGRALPSFVQREFEEYLKCGRLGRWDDVCTIIERPGVATQHRLF